jgi:hypothetical protein
LEQHGLFGFGSIGWKRWAQDRFKRPNAFSPLPINAAMALNEYVALIKSISLTRG